MNKPCNCGQDARAIYMVAERALEELRRHDPEAADRILAAAARTEHRDYCGDIGKFLEAKRKTRCK